MYLFFTNMGHYLDNPYMSSGVRLFPRWLEISLELFFDPAAVLNVEMCQMTSLLPCCELDPNATLNSLIEFNSSTWLALFEKIYQIVFFQHILCFCSTFWNMKTFLGESDELYRKTILYTIYMYLMDNSLSTGFSVIPESLYLEASCDRTCEGAVRPLGIYLPRMQPTKTTKNNRCSRGRLKR